MYIRSLEAIREDLSEAKRKKSWKDIGQIIETINKIVMMYISPIMQQKKNF